IIIIIIIIIFPLCGVTGKELIVLRVLQLPEHLHALYIEWVYYDRREQGLAGRLKQRLAPGIYSKKVQSGGHGQGNYGTLPA
ncbi:hypothetical protein EX30DRAFT_308871, partial [Ascodesmis nigricans]